ncbi:unnamed protein product, partial [Dibothriocephalus latus]
MSISILLTTIVPLPSAKQHSLTALGFFSGRTESFIIADASLYSTLEKESRIAAIAQTTVPSSVNLSTTDARLPLLTSVEEFEVAVRNSPSNPRLWVLYAAYHQDRSQVSEARSVYERALKLSQTLPAVQATTFTSTIL